MFTSNISVRGFVNSKAIKLAFEDRTVYQMSLTSSREDEQQHLNLILTEEQFALLSKAVFVGDLVEMNIRLKNKVVRDQDKAFNTYLTGYPVDRYFKGVYQGSFYTLVWSRAGNKSRPPKKFRIEERAY